MEPEYGPYYGWHLIHSYGFSSFVVNTYVWDFNERYSRVIHRISSEAYTTYKDVVTGTVCHGSFSTLRAECQAIAEELSDSE